MSSWGTSPKFSFVNPPPSQANGRLTCTRKKSCPSDTIHYPGCKGLTIQLEKFKQNRREWYAKGGFNGR